MPITHAATDKALGANLGKAKLPPNGCLSPAEAGFQSTYQAAQTAAEFTTFRETYNQELKKRAPKGFPAPRYN